MFVAVIKIVFVKRRVYLGTGCMNILFLFRVERQLLVVKIG